MELRDFIVTPIFFLLIYGVAYFVRPYATDATTRPYFLPALTFKLVGALAVGFIYQFYYGSGDTFMYHTYGSRIVWNAIIDSPWLGMKLLFTDGKNYQDIYQYASTIYFFRDPNSYAIIRLATVFDLFTFSTYSSTASLFAVLGFTGAWQFYLTFYKQYPHLHRSLAIAALFIPSVVFWGSGILKDSVTLAFIGIATSMIYRLFVERRVNFWNIVILIFSLYAVYSIKIFILQAYLPAVIVWMGTINFRYIRSWVLKIMIVPFMFAVLILSSYYAVVKVSEDDLRYDISKLAETAKVTAYDIRYQSGRDAGSGYSLGELDGSFASMIRLAPQAINVSLFRPYLWEVRNPLMLISSLESLLFLFVSVWVVVKKKLLIVPALLQPNVIFTVVFSITYAFAVGVSTYNFGTLARYKIPMLPFFLTALILISDYSKSEKKLSPLDDTE